MDDKVAKIRWVAAQVVGCILHLFAVRAVLDSRPMNVGNATA